MKKHLPSGWKEVRLGDICEYFRGLSYNKQNVVDFGLLVLRSNNIQNYNIDLSDDELQFVNKNCNDDILLKKHDIVICMANGTKKLVGKSAEYKGNYKGKITIGAFCGLLRTKNVLLKYILQTKVYRDYIGIILAGTNINNLRSSELLDFTFQIPTSIDEQKRIAEILSTFDDLIENLTKLIEKKELYKKGVMQRVLTGKVRFNGFTDEWELTTLDKIIVEKSIRNKDNKINLVLSVTNKEGFVIQNEFFGKTIASKDLSNYKIVDKYDFAYNPARVNVGSISMLENFDSCIVSPMYVVFSLNKLKIDKYFFKYWIQSNNFNGHIRSLSAGSVRSILSFDAMSTMKIKLPSIEEQNKIAELLTLIDKDIEILKQLLHLRKLQKKGVMQKLLTGEVRV